MKKRAPRNEDSSPHMANSPPAKKPTASAQLPIEDRRPQALAQRKLQAMMDSTTRARQFSPVQKKANKVVQATDSGAEGSQLGSVGGVVQLVNDKGVRVQTDSEMDAVKDQASLILNLMQKKVSNWKPKLAKEGKAKGQQKAKEQLSGKKGESTGWKVVKEIWDHLEDDEKVTICTEIVTQGAKGIGTAIRAWAESESSEEPKNSSSKTERKHKKRDSQDGSSMLSDMLGAAGELTLGDLETMYHFMKEYRGIKKEVASLKSEFIQKIGEIGEGLGEFAGSILDDSGFKSLIAEFQGVYTALETAYRDLSKRIEENADKDRYSEEFKALDEIFVQRRGIGLAMLAGGVIPPDRQAAFPELCRTNIVAIKEAARDKSAREILSGGAKKAKEAVLSLGSKPDPETAMDDAATTLQRVLWEPSWSKVTRFGSAPDGIVALRKMVKVKGAGAYLLEAQQQNFGSHLFRNDITKAFYKTIKDLDLTDPGSLKDGTLAFQATESQLQKKK